MPRPKAPASQAKSLIWALWTDLERKHEYGMEGVYEYILDGFKITEVVTDPLWKENCYLITSASGEQALIDPGYDADRLADLISQNGDRRLTWVLLTHAHHDHVGAVTPICRMFSIPAYLHKDDHKLIRHAPMYAIRFGRQPIPMPQPVNFFEAPHVFELGALTLRALHVPGHTKGGAAFVLGDALFTGDTLMHKHVGRADLPGSDMTMLKQSVDKLLSEHHDTARIFAGHGKPWTIGEAREWWASAKNEPGVHDHFDTFA